MKPSERLLGSVALVAMALGCNADQPSGLDRSKLSARFDPSAGSEAPLVEHIVAPQATDPAIDKFLDDHYAWLDTAAQSNQKLFVFMPGAGQVPAMFQLVQQEAARLGYHVVGLSYVTRLGGVVFTCPIAPDPASCYENTRLEIVDGVDRSPLVDISQANSIDNRLTKLLQYLAAQYPDEGWDKFLLAGDQPKWSQIAIAGHSQGGGEAATIAKIRLVARVVLFSSVTDSVHSDAPAWESTHMTPTERYWGIAHDRDLFFPAIRAGWDSIGLAAFGAPVDPATSEPPYGWTRMLVTDVTPVGGFVGTNAHGSPSNDANTPLLADGTPLFREAWDYLLTGRPRRPGLGEQAAERGSGGGTR